MNSTRHIPVMIILLLCYQVEAGAQDRLSGQPFASRSEVLARHAMAATSHPLATQIALDILKKGGSAVDAAIAANAFLGLADPGMCGIGGDLFAIVWDAKTKRLYGLNASGNAPQSLSLSYLKEQQKKGNPYYKGALSVTTPGCVDGWFELHKKFGKLPFAQLLAPVIQYAKEGVPVTEETADFFQLVEADFKRDTNVSFQKVFFVNGRFRRKGQLFQNPDLAHTLELISKQGSSGFYEGEVALKIENHLKSRGGFLSRNDLAAYHAEWVAPVSTNYRGYDVWEMPPNSQGIAALEILNILEGYNIAAMGYGSAAYTHCLLEAKKLAYEDLAKIYGDPKRSAISVDALLSKPYAAKRRQQINPDKAGVYQPGLPSGDHTVYLTVADQEGNIISLIQSLSSLFGSAEVPEGLGFALQNRGGDFVLEEGHVNSYAPGKRPFHTIMPGFVTRNGKPFLSFGVMGGDMQPQGQVQVLVNIIDFGMNLQEAGDAPRMFHEGTTNYGGHLEGVGSTYLETGFKPEVIRSLMDKGHLIRMGKGIFGGYQAIMLKNGVYYGASESRKDGQAAGY